MIAAPSKALAARCAAAREAERVVGEHDGLVESIRAGFIEGDLRAANRENNRLNDLVLDAVDRVVAFKSRSLADVLTKVDLAEERGWLAKGEFPEYFGLALVRDIRLLAGKEAA